MESVKRIQSMNFQNPFPETVIQRIQSFLTGKQAAQTTILSKSWFSAWLTRPNLDFEGFLGFEEIATNTLQRYHDSNLLLQSFSLRRLSSRDNHNELVVKALKLGATHLNLEFVNPKSDVVLPEEVLESETLVGLSLRGCTVGGKGNLRCSRLESLSLNRVYAAGSVVSDIFSNCSLIHDLSLCNVRSMAEPTVFTPENPCEFRKMKRLHLEDVSISSSFFDNFSFKFPCLKNLHVHACGLESIRISSSSLESLSLEQCMTMVELDLPRIRKFKFSTDTERATIEPVPTLIFKTLSTKWESRICILLSKHLFTSETLVRLKFLLSELSSSKISLYLSCRWMSEDVVKCAPILRGLRKVAVEELDLFMMPEVVTDAMKGLFCICRPKLIRNMSFPYQCEEEDEPDYLMMKFLRNKLKDSNLREVNVKLFGETRNSLLLVPLKKFLIDVSRKVRRVDQICCFELSWGDEATRLV